MNDKMSIVTKVSQPQHCTDAAGTKPAGTGHLSLSTRYEERRRLNAPGLHSRRMCSGRAFQSRTVAKWKETRPACVEHLGSTYLLVPVDIPLQNSSLLTR